MRNLQLEPEANVPAEQAIQMIERTLADLQVLQDALDALRDGVQEAIAALGRGFLQHPANAALKQSLKRGDLSTPDYYRQLLRVVYRLIFLFVAEDRGLLLAPDTPAAIQEKYARFYSAGRLRSLAEARRGGPHPDLYRALRLLCLHLRDGYAPLGLPALGSFLFSDRATPALDAADIANTDLLNAIRALAFSTEGRVRRAVDYKNLGAEELGSVYELLLELHPQLNVDAGAFTLETAAGSERKTTGSYYTPAALINCLLDSALEPVIADRLKEAWEQGSAGGGEKNTQHATRNTLEQAILDIKVVDPACGSGHFLIAAANRLALHLARVRTGDDEPSPSDRRAALRDVVHRCLHGVDINPMAVELCKVALWMEMLDPGRPLGSLDRNIQCGNSLIGATPALLRRGIPDDAFKPILGDDKAYCREFRKKNRQQRSGQLALLTDDLQPWQRLGNLAEGMLHLRDVGDATVDDVRRQEALYTELVNSGDYKFGRLWADAWCAAFVWVKKPEVQGGYAYPITEQLFRDIERTPHSCPPWIREEIERLREQYQFFHWHLAFPHVFRPKTEDMDEDDAAGWEGGFDVVLGNPPWERIKIQEKEWFATRDPEIANARNAAARRRLINQLAETQPALHADFLADKRQAEGESHFVRSSARYPLCGRGDVNTYTIFAELARHVVSGRGRAGVIVPSGIATDDTTKYYFQDIMETAVLVSLYDFENRDAIFPGVHRSYKFCLLTLRGHDTGQDEGQPAAEFVFFAHQTNDLRDPERRFTLSAEEIALLNPNTRTCPIFRGRRDAELTKAIYRRVPVLIKEGPPEENPWGIRFSTMFHMSNDSHLFRMREQLEGAGWHLRGNHFERDDEVYLPLYEAKMAQIWDHRAADVIRSATAQQRQAQPASLDISSHIDPYRLVFSLYWVRSQDVEENLPDGWSKRWLIGFTNVSSPTNERSFLPSLVPLSGVGNSMPLLFPLDFSELTTNLVANLSSFIFDYVVRQKMGGVNLNFYLVKQFPVMTAETFKSPSRWCGHTARTTHHSWLLPRVVELSYTAYDLLPFAQDCGYYGPPFRWDDERRFLLRCELDAAYFHLYGIERDDVDYIMETFPIVRRKDEAAHGEYRTKRVILEIYDALAEAMRSGVPYQTQLDPPPGDPAAAHPWDETYLGPPLDPSAWWQDSAVESDDGAADSARETGG